MRRMESSLDSLNIPELLSQILANISDGRTYKAARLVSRSWLLTVGDRVDEFSNHLWTLIEKFPNENWNYNYITSNPNTRIEWVLDFDKLDIRYDYMNKVYKSISVPAQLDMALVKK